MFRTLMLLMLVAVAIALPYPQETSEVLQAVPVEGETVDARQRHHHHLHHHRPHGGFGGYGNNYGGYGGYNNYGYNRYPPYGGYYGGLWREGQKPSADGTAAQPAPDVSPVDPLVDAAPGTVSFE